MCVVKHKTYVYAGQRHDVIRKQYRCHHAPPDSLCAHIEERNDCGGEAVRVVERRLDGHVDLPTTNVIVANGREYRYFPLVEQFCISV
jgi:hypothetical protein